MIPKIIHYCWFGGNPLPELAIKCIESWKKYLPDYEIKEWNESNFDVNMIPYTAEAYRLKKYAFVSDYARFYVLYRYGGLYFDTDVEVIRNMDDIIARGPFMGMEAGNLNIYHGPKKRVIDEACEEVGIGSKDDSVLDFCVNPGLGLGVTPGLEFYKDMLDSYAKKHFVTWLGTTTETVVTATTKLLNRRRTDNLGEGIFKNGEVYLYAPVYFCPQNYFTGELSITERTVSIHHYMATWVKDNSSIRSRVKKRFDLFGTRLMSSFGLL